MGENKPGKGTVRYNKLGEYEVEYNCKDKDSNEAVPVSRYVTVQDTTKPVCALKGAKTVTHEAGFKYSDKGVVCKDSFQGQVKAKRSSNVNYKKVGTYTVTYTATDSSGNQAASVSRKVVIRDTLKPVIGLKYGAGKKYFHVSDSTDTATLHDGSKVTNPAG